MKLRGLKCRMASLAVSVGKTFVPKVDDKRVIGYDGLHTQKRATRPSVAFKCQRSFLDASAEIHK
jgi:hypothetical protein